MARRRRRRKKKNLLDYIVLPRIRLELDPDTKKGIIIILLFAIGTVSFLALFGKAGQLGIYMVSLLEALFGWGKWMFPVILLALGYFLFNEDRYEVRGANYLGLFLFVVSFQSLLWVFTPMDEWTQVKFAGEGGGFFGLYTAKGLLDFTGFWVTFITLIAVFLSSFTLMFNTSIIRIFGRDSFVSKLFLPLVWVSNKLFKREEDEDEEEEDDEEEHDEDEDEEEEDDEEEHDEDEDEEEEDDEEEHDEDEDEEEEDDEEEHDKELEEGEEENEDEDEDNEEHDEAGEDAFASKAIRSETEIDKKLGTDKLKSWWEPTGVEVELPLKLLTSKGGKPTSGDIGLNKERIKHTLEHFNIPVDMADVSVGPTVTQYTFKPAEGIKLSRITALNNDLALALAAHPIRIEAPIPMKSLVGVEVPNVAKAIVGLKEIVNSKGFKEGENDLMLSVGKDVSGKAWSYSLGKMPHLLVAGATGSGKSVCLNAIIVSLLYQNSPDDLRFIMVDPKRVELPVYDGIPHLLTRVITDVPKTINALKWCLNEMDRRLELLSSWGKKDIASFNANGQAKAGHLPYIVFIIDELADLMVVAGKEVEAGIIRLAQMARAVGIHLILATQRPSVDVITGLIKANMPARIAFSVASGIDSRTILDSLGAEKLLGRGDMLFSTPEISKPVRLQGAFVSEEEISKIVKYLIKKGGKAYYEDSVTERQKVRGMGGVGLNAAGTEDEDELFIDAKDIVITMGRASASLLQRKLSIGYARAARILDMLEESGIVGPAHGAKPREILVSKEQYASVEASGVSGVSLHDREETEKPDKYLEDDEKEDNEEYEDENGENDEREEEEEDEGEEKNEEDEESDEEGGDEGKYFSR